MFGYAPRALSYRYLLAGAEMEEAGLGDGGDCFGRQENADASIVRPGRRQGGTQRGRDSLGVSLG